MNQPNNGKKIFFRGFSIHSSCRSTWCVYACTCVNFTGFIFMSSGEADSIGCIGLINLWSFMNS